MLAWVGSRINIPRTSGFVDLASDAKFTRTAHREPHLQRRRALLAARPEIRRLFGFDRRTIAVTVGVVLTQLALAWGMQRATLPWVATVALAWFPGAILSHWLGQSIHETAHNLAARTRLANRAVAWLANVPLVLPIAETFHRYHLVHHVHLGVEGIDSDLPVPFEVRHIGKSWVSKLLWLSMYPVVYLVRGTTYAKGVSLAEVQARARCNESVPGGNANTSGRVTAAFRQRGGSLSLARNVRSFRMPPSWIPSGVIEKIVESVCRC